jgi:hypothetical protein
MPNLRNVTEKNLMIKQLSLSKVDVKNLMMAGGLAYVRLLRIKLVKLFATMCCLVIA